MNRCIRNKSSMVRSTCIAAKMLKIRMDIQKPCAPELFTASSPVRPCEMTWKLVSMSLLWKLNSTSSRTPVITESSSTASQSQTLTLAEPVKYARVMRQYCLPQVVKRPISTSIAMVDTAAIAQALAIHTTDVQSSLPQSNVGVNISMRARYLGRLPPALQEALTPGRERIEPPFSAADEFEPAAVKLLNRAAVTHADQNGLRELGTEQFVQHQLEPLVHRRGRLVQEHCTRLAQQDAGEGDSLLFPDRQHLCPLADVVEPDDQV